MAVFSGWTAADHVQQATRRGLAVNRGRRAAQQGQAIEVPGFLFRGGVRAFRQWQAIEELGRFKTTNAQPVGTGVAAVAAGGDAGQVAHGVIEILHIAIVHLLAGDDRNRARCFEQRGVGFGAGGGASRQVAVYRAPGAFGVLRADDGSFRQSQCALGRGDQAVGAGAALFQLQAGAAQGFTQGSGSVELALHRCRGLACRQRWVQRQRQTGLTGDLIQGAGQWRGRQVVGANAGCLFSSDQLGAGQRGAKGYGDGQQAGAQQGV